ncbi:MAG: 50S ribosomal protein L11 methyltransferase [Geothermobacteraceae bacterium]
MNSDWIEIRLTVPAEQIETVSALLFALGAGGVVTAERPLDTFVPPDPDEPETGASVLKAYFQHREEKELTTEIGAMLAGGWLDPVPDIESRPVGAQDWAEGWKQHFRPFTIGRLLVRPTWDPTEPDPEQTLLTIDPGMAFGTGSHGTTRLCLQAVAELVPEQADSVLDVGTGSGILAVAAALLGAERVIGCDIDAQACATAKENAQLNGVGDRVVITDEPLSEIPGRFDLVIANILAEENIRLAGQLIDHLRPGGHLVLSGILGEKVDLVRDTFDGHMGASPQVHYQDEWASLVYRRT